MRLSFCAVTAGVAAIVMALAACTGSDPVITDVATDDSGGIPSGGDSGGPQGDGGGPGQTDTGGGDAADTGPQRYCATQAPLTGVANFFCADFDGTKLDEGFTKTNLADGGALLRNSDIFHSSPSSFSTQGDATVEWDSVAATPFTEITATFQLNVGTLGGVTPPSDGHTTILQIGAPAADTVLTLNYAKGATINGTANFTGYYVTVEACPSACQLAEFPITTNLTAGVWTQVSVTWNVGGVIVLYNNVKVYSQPAPFPTSTVINTMLGEMHFGAAVALPRHAFDDLTVAVRRQ